MTRCIATRAAVEEGIVLAAAISAAARRRKAPSASRRRTTTKDRRRDRPQGAVGSFAKSPHHVEDDGFRSSVRSLRRISTPSGYDAQNHRIRQSLFLRASSTWIIPRMVIHIRGGSVAALLITEAMRSPSCRRRIISAMPSGGGNGRDGFLYPSAWSILSMRMYAPGSNPTRVSTLRSLISPLGEPGWETC